MKIAALLLAFISAALGNDTAGLIADRALIERVYHDHRTGTKPPFEQVMPEALLRKHVEMDLHKESVLRKVYGVEITPAMIDAEVRRIDTSTRAPEMLAEVKRALGGDAARFAQSMARPIVVERELRKRFENDDALHASQRATATELRAKWIAGGAVASAGPVTWCLGPRPVAAAPLSPGGPVTGESKGGVYSNEATVQIAQPLTKPGAGDAAEKLYFEDLAPDMQAVVRAQLRKPGDVSSVIEADSVFVVLRAKEISEKEIAVESAAVPKRNYEQWLAEQK
jgi:hypothetical protein